MQQLQNEEQKISVTGIAGRTCKMLNRNNMHITSTNNQLNLMNSFDRKAGS